MLRSRKIFASIHVLALSFCLLLLCGLNGVPHWCDPGGGVHSDDCRDIRIIAGVVETVMLGYAWLETPGAALLSTPEVGSKYKCTFCVKEPILVLCNIRYFWFPKKWVLLGAYT